MNIFSALNCLKRKINTQKTHLAFFPWCKNDSSFFFHFPRLLFIHSLSFWPGSGSANLCGPGSGPGKSMRIFIFIGVKFILFFFRVMWCLMYLRRSAWSCWASSTKPNPLRQSGRHTNRFVMFIGIISYCSALDPKEKDHHSNKNTIWAVQRSAMQFDLEFLSSISRENVTRRYIYVSAHQIKHWRAKTKTIFSIVYNSK